MRIDHDAIQDATERVATRVAGRRTSRANGSHVAPRRAAERAVEHEDGPDTSSSERLVRALYDHNARFTDWTPERSGRERRDRRPVPAAARAELLTGLSGLATVSRLVGPGRGGVEPFHTVLELWRQDLAEEVYQRWSVRDSLYSFFLYAAYEDRGFVTVGLRDATALVLAPGLDRARSVDVGCATCGRPVMPDLTPWLPPPADPAYCCAACERRTVTAREAWEIGETLGAWWERERASREQTKSLDLYDPTDVDRLGDHGAVLAMAGVDVLATLRAQLRAGPLVGLIVLVDGSAFVQTLERFGPTSWRRRSAAAVRALIRRAPFARRQVPGTAR